MWNLICRNTGHSRWTVRPTRHSVQWKSGEVCDHGFKTPPHFSEGLFTSSVGSVVRGSSLEFVPIRRTRQFGSQSSVCTSGVGGAGSSLDAGVVRVVLVGFTVGVKVSRESTEWQFVCTNFSSLKYFTPFFGTLFGLVEYESSVNPRVSSKHVNEP